MPRSRTIITKVPRESGVVTSLYARAIREAFATLGLSLFSQPGAHSVTVVAGELPPGIDAAQLLRKLREERGVVLSGGQAEFKGKIVRMGTMGDVAQTDVLGALGALEIALLEYGAPLRAGAGVQAALRVFLEATPDAGQRSDGRTDARTTEALR